MQGSVCVYVTAFKFTFNDVIGQYLQFIKKSLRPWTNTKGRKLTFRGTTLIENKISHSTKNAPTCFTITSTKITLSHGNSLFLVFYHNCFVPSTHKIFKIFKLKSILLSFPNFVNTYSKINM